MFYILGPPPTRAVREWFILRQPVLIRNDSSGAKLSLSETMGSRLTSSDADSALVEPALRLDSLQDLLDFSG
jgi:hypothetical protein